MDDVVSLSWVTLYVNPDGRLRDRSVIESVTKSVIETFGEVCERRRYSTSAEKNGIDKARLDLYLVNTGDEGPYLGSRTRVLQDEGGREASGDAVVVVQDWTSFSGEEKKVFAVKCLDNYFKDIAGGRGRIRSIPVGVEPRDVMWRWLDGVPNSGDTEHKLASLRASLEDYSRERLLRLGDDVIAALSLIDTPGHYDTAVSNLGPLSEDMFAELRGFVILLGRSCFDDFNGAHRLPVLPDEGEWSPAGEDMRFLVSNQLGWDAWDRF